MTLNSKIIKQKAIELGFSKVGISRAEPTPKERKRLINWISNNKNGSMKWINDRRDERGNIHTYFKQAKSIISVALNYYTGVTQKNIKSDYKFSNYAWGDDYHKIIKKKLFTLLDWVRNHDKDISGVVCADTSPVMEKVWAQKSGLGWIGKHTNLITKDYGSWVFLGELILDVELEYDFSFEEDLCGSCSLCIESCPTQALEDYQIDSKKCISYLNIEYRGDFPENSNDLHGWIYGCDICQNVCPWNIKFSQLSDETKFKPKKEIISWTNKDWHNLDEFKFRKLFKGSAVKRTKYKGLKRNIIKNKENR